VRAPADRRDKKTTVCKGDRSQQTQHQDGVSHAVVQVYDPEKSEWLVDDIWNRCAGDQPRCRQS
jgi:hypothetical protein